MSRPMTCICIWIVIYTCSLYLQLCICYSVFVNVYIIIYPCVPCVLRMLHDTLVYADAKREYYYCTTTCTVAVFRYC